MKDRQDTYSDDIWCEWLYSSTDVSNLYKQVSAYNDQTYIDYQPYQRIMKMVFVTTTMVEIRLSNHLLKQDDDGTHWTYT